jgi:uncharacterized protein
MSLARKMLVVFVDENDTAGELPLYEAIVRRLVQRGVAGATVMAGIMGFGAQHHVHHKRLFGVSDDRPVTICVVDEEQKLRSLLPEIRPMVEDGLIILLDCEQIQ